METQNVTLSLPKDVLRKIKVLAAKHETSVSAMLVRALQDLVRRDEAYEQAKRHHLKMLRRPLNIGTRGAITWTRDDLHERR